MTNEIDHTSARNKQVDEFEHLLISNFEPIDFPIRNFFVDGMYAREMTAFADSWVVSKIHKTDHFFVLSKGKLIVSVDEGEEVVLEAPYTGITKAGTRRVAYIVEDVIWTTFHDNPDNENVEQIEARIIEPHTNELLTEEMVKRINSVKKQIETISLIN